MMPDNFPKDVNSYIRLARHAIKKYIEDKKIISVPENLPAELYKKESGVFVSIYQKNTLRGCIGTYLPSYENLAKEIIMNAVAACSRDGRFLPVISSELPDISVEVSVLSAPEEIFSLEDLDPKKYGIIVKSSGGKCGLLLPDIKGINETRQQLSIVLEKAGIEPRKEKTIKMYRFTVRKYA